MKACFAQDFCKMLKNTETNVSARNSGLSYYDALIVKEIELPSGTVGWMFSDNSLVFLVNGHRLFSYTDLAEFVEKAEVNLGGKLYMSTNLRVTKSA